MNKKSFQRDDKKIKAESQNFLDPVLAKPESYFNFYFLTFITQNQASIFQIYLKN